MRAELTRRAFVAGAVVVAAGCSRERQKVRRERRVSVIRAASYAADLTSIVGRILDEHKVAVRGKRIVLKPNLVEYDPGRPINTRPELVFAVSEAFAERGAASVRIAEGPGHRRGTMDLAAAAGYFAAVPRFEERFTDLNLDEVARVQLDRSHSGLRELYLPETVLGCDLLVSVAKMKTHHWAGATLSMKNLFGVVPGSVYGWPKNVLHWAGIPQCIADLHSLFPNQFAIVDGIVGMEGNGPILGSPKQAGVIVGGSDPISVDATCCRLMGIDPAKVEYIQLAARRTGWDDSHVRQIGETIRSTASNFELAPGHAHLRLMEGVV